MTRAKETKSHLQTRTIRVPIAEVDGDKQEFYAQLRRSLRTSCETINRCLTYCAVQDRAVWESRAGSKLPKLPKLDCYAALLKGRSQGMAYPLNLIARQAEKSYKHQRWDVAVGKASLRLQRSWPVPIACNKSTRDLRIEREEGGAVWATIRVLDQWWRVKLRGGSNYRRQLRAIETAEQFGDSKVWIDRRGRAVLGIAVKLPKQRRRRLQGTLHLKTSTTAFLVATKEHSDTPFTINADHVRRWQAERKRKQQRLRQDGKSGTARRKIRQLQAQLSRKYQDRVGSFMQEASSHIVAHARRRKVARLEFDATLKRYFGPDFPYYEFGAMLRYKAEAAGIEYVDVTPAIRPAVEDEPHVYMALGVDRSTRRLRNVKIGKTRRRTGVRQQDDAFAKDQDWVILFTEAVAHGSLHKRETHYKAMFAEHRINGETFRREPVIEWLRETGNLGNTGNLSQIAQYLET